MPFLTGYNYRAPIKQGATIPSSNLTGFPLYINAFAPLASDTPAEGWAGLAGQCRAASLAEKIRVTGSDGTTEVPFEIIQLQMLEWSIAGQDATADSGTDALTKSGVGGITPENGNSIKITGGTPPGGLSLNTPYFVVNASAGTWQLSTTFGGSPIDLTSNGSGIQYSVETVAFKIFAKFTLSSAAVAGDTIGYLYYDMDGSSGEDIPNTWNANYVGPVYHFNQDPTGGAGSVLDSTSNNRDGSASNMESGDLVASEIGYGLSFDGTDESVATGSISWPSGGLTIELLASVNTLAVAALSSVYDGSNAYMQLFILSDGTLTGRIHATKDVDYIGRATNTGAVSTSLQLISMTWDGTTASSGIKLFVNGSQVDASNSAAGSFGGSYTGSLPLQIAVQNTGAYAHITASEFRVSNEARSGDWIAYTSANLLTNSSTVTMGAEELSSGGISADLPAAAVAVASVSPTSTKDASLAAQAVAVATVAPTAAKSASLDAQAVAVASVSPVVTRDAALAAQPVTVATPGLEEAINAELDAQAVAVASVSPLTTRDAALDVQVLVVTDPGQDTSTGTSLDAGTVAVVAVALGSSKDVAASVEVVVVTGVALETTSSGEIDAGTVAVTAVSPTTEKQADLPTSAVAVAGVSPTTSHEASLDVQVLVVTGVALGSSKDASLDSQSLVVAAPTILGNVTGVLWSVEFALEISPFLEMTMEVVPNLEFSMEIE